MSKLKEMATCLLLVAGFTAAGLMLLYSLHVLLEALHRFTY